MIDTLCYAVIGGSVLLSGMVVLPFEAIAAATIGVLQGPVLWQGRYIMMAILFFLFIDALNRISTESTALTLQVDLYKKGSIVGSAFFSIFLLELIISFKDKILKLQTSLKRIELDRDILKKQATSQAEGYKNAISELDQLKKGTTASPSPPSQDNQTIDPTEFLDLKKKLNDLQKEKDFLVNQLNAIQPKGNKKND
eukprot:TRINITY_DN3740_c0_g3_i1.p1 TRINITY_DN3740_c0_g3~~TRINITY_DN3740_c0_g3_i1.p1  ORF type:complete len:197 (+),score=53.09 TRINITY_DN3740_c0_g3_i1:54-644(+)